VGYDDSDLHTVKRYLYQHWLSCSILISLSNNRNLLKQLVPLQIRYKNLISLFRCIG